MIPEEGDNIDLTPLCPPTASPPHIQPAVASPMSPDPETMTFDLSTIGGLRPWTAQDDAEIMNSLQQQEASGHLTGGLGQGFRSSTTIREADLLAGTVAQGEASPSMRSLSLSSRKRRSQLGRQATVRARAQDEADRRGEIIEVIMDVDISDLDGPPAHAPTFYSMGSNGSRSAMMGAAATGSPPIPPNKDPNGPGTPVVMQRSTFPQKEQLKQVFYPQPNWKPFTMRAPYLLFLIVLSIGLGVSLEMFYRQSARQALVTFRQPNQIPDAIYFALKFAPTLISVMFGVLWQMTDFEVRRLEAFYQLSREGGALAAESINVDYITYFSFFRPVRALRCRHYAVLTSSLASLLAVSLVPTLGAASIVLSPGRQARLDDPLGVKYISISHVWSRVLTTVFFVIAALGCLLFWQLQRRKSGLLSDVKGIAGLASMAVVSHILMDFKDMDTATHQEIHRQVKDHRYVLLNSSLAPDESNRPPSSSEADRYRSSGLSENPHPLMLRAAGAGPLIAGVLAFLVLVLLVLFTEAEVLTDRAPWLVTALAVCIKMGWSGLETDLRMMEPYYLLWRRHAPPRTLTLDYTAMPFGWVAIRAALNRHWLIFFVGFGTVMSEVLTVMSTSLANLSGRDFVDQKGHPLLQAPLPLSPSLSTPSANANATVPTDTSNNINAGQETPLSFWITLGIATFILLYMAGVATTVYWMRRRPFLPRQPNTIASVLAFIHQSRMLYDFVGTSKYNSTKMKRRLEEIGDTYGLGWFKGRDGLPHCGVDREELLSDYKPGYNYNMATKPWLSQDYL